MAFTVVFEHDYSLPYQLINLAP